LEDISDLIAGVHLLIQIRQSKDENRPCRVEGLLTWKSLTGIAETVQKHRIAEARTRDRNNIRREDERKRRKK
jgi:hypothetical protein